jgi:hypothetical protein
MKYQQHTFQNSIEVIDGNEYEACEFRNCRIVYRGGPLPKLNNCHFIDPQFALEEAAGRTVMFLNAMYHASDWGKQYAEATIENLIRKK